MKRLFALLALLLLGLPTAAQTSTAITPYSIVRGTLAAGESAAYTFSGVAGQVISAWVQGDSALDPTLTLRDSSGRVLLTADDTAYPERRDALLEAVSLPRTDQYTLTVGGFADTAGDYSLIFTNGFADLRYRTDLDSAAEWSALGDTVVSAADGSLSLTFAGERGHGAAAESQFSAADVSVQASVLAVDATRGWSAGLIARQQGDRYYLYEINDEGRWRFSLVDGESVTVLSDWRSHPAIRPGATQFTLMLMARRSGFGLFYDSAFVGAVSDRTLADAGAVGLAAGSYGALAGETTVRFDQVRASVPLETSGGLVVPETVMVGNPAAVAQALTWRHVAEADGVMALTVPEASVNFARTGINRFMLGQGTTYTNFALGATVNIGAGRPAAVGCGFVFRFADDQNYSVAFLDALGGYGVSPRIEDVFEPGLYGENPDWAGGGEHHLLILADGPRLYFYVDGANAGSVEIPEQAGQVGIAALNYETVDTACRFENLWLWTWD